MSRTIREARPTGERARFVEPGHGPARIFVHGLGGGQQRSPREPERHRRRPPSQASPLRER